MAFCNILLHTFFEKGVGGGGVRGGGSIIKFHCFHTSLVPYILFSPLQKGSFIENLKNSVFERIKVLGTLFLKEVFCFFTLIALIMKSLETYYW